MTTAGSDHTIQDKAVVPDETRPTFDALYAEAYAPMVRFAALIVDTVDDAEHVVQDAFLAIYKRYDRLDNPGAYLRITVLNGSRKLLRRRRVMRRRPPEATAPAELEFNHVIDQVRRLPHDQRLLIAMRYEQQMTDAEIAADLGIPVGTVKSRLFRAIRTLREETS